MLWMMTLALADPVDDYIAENTVDQTVVILASERSYTAALTKLAEVAAKTDLAVDLRGISYQPAHRASDGGLTLSESACFEHNELSYPCLPPCGNRARAGTNTGLSIEWSNTIPGLTPGLYVLIGGVGERGDLQPVLTKAKTVVKDAYLKKIPVYMGCMH